MTGGEKGFTLIEVIAVLIIIGVLAAIAVPRYIELIDNAKMAAAKGEVAEMKSTLNLAYAKLFMSNGSPGGAASVLATAGFSSGTATDIGTAPDIWNMTLTAVGNQVIVAINNRNGDVSYSTAGTWNLPQ